MQPRIQEKLNFGPFLPRLQCLRCKLCFLRFVALLLSLQFGNGVDLLKTHQNAGNAQHVDAKESDEQWLKGKRDTHCESNIQQEQAKQDTMAGRKNCNGKATKTNSHRPLCNKVPIASALHCRTESTAAELNPGDASFLSAVGCARETRRDTSFDIHGDASYGSDLLP